MSFLEIEGPKLEIENKV